MTMFRPISAKRHLLSNSIAELPGERRAVATFPASVGMWWVFFLGVLGFLVWWGFFIKKGSKIAQALD